jgi:glycolate oxidase
MGQINDYMCLDGTIPVNELPYVLKRIGEMSKEYGLVWPTCSTRAMATCTR